MHPNNSPKSCNGKIINEVFNLTIQLFSSFQALTVFICYDSFESLNPHHLTPTPPHLTSPHLPGDHYSLAWEDVNCSLGSIILGYYTSHSLISFLCDTADSFHAAGVVGAGLPKQLSLMRQNTEQLKKSFYKASHTPDIWLDNVSTHIGAWCEQEYI